MNKEQSSDKDKINEDSDIDMKPVLLWYMGATTHRPKIVLADRIYFSYPEKFFNFIKLTLTVYTILNIKTW